MTVEADIIHDIPADLAEIIGRVIVAYARIVHNLTSLAGLLLQLNKFKCASRFGHRAPLTGGIWR